MKIPRTDYLVELPYEPPHTAPTPNHGITLAAIGAVVLVIAGAVWQAVAAAIR